jgi:exocyst complex component 4
VTCIVLQYVSQHLVHTHLNRFFCQEAITDKNELYRRERDAEAGLMGDKPIEKDDLISPLRNVSALCNLHRSVVRSYIPRSLVLACDTPKSWFTAGLNLLRAAPEGSLSPTSGLQMEPTSATTPFTPSLPSLVPPDPDERLQLPLSREMALCVSPYL